MLGEHFWPFDENIQLLDILEVLQVFNFRSSYINWGGRGAHIDILMEDMCERPQLQ